MPLLVDFQMPPAADARKNVFDGEGIARLVDPDFELHGLREGLAVIAAAVAVGVAAGAANAAPVDEGAAVKAGEPVVIVESMKMEIVVAAPCDGRVHKLYCREGAQVAAGQDLLVIEAAA